MHYKLDTEHPTTQLAYDYVEELTEIFTKSSKICETQQIRKHQYKSANKWHDRESKTLRDIFIKERNKLKKRKNPQSLHATQIARLT